MQEAHRTRKPLNRHDEYEMSVARCKKARRDALCPVTGNSRLLAKGYPFGVGVDFDGVTSVVLADRIKSLDWKARRARKKGIVPS